MEGLPPVDGGDMLRTPLNLGAASDNQAEEEEPNKEEEEPNNTNPDLKKEAE